MQRLVSRPLSVDQLSHDKTAKRYEYNGDVTPTGDALDGAGAEIQASTRDVFLILLRSKGVRTFPSPARSLQDYWEIKVIDRDLRTDADNGYPNIIIKKWKGARYEIHNSLTGIWYIPYSARVPTLRESLLFISPRILDAIDQWAWLFISATCITLGIWLMVS